MRKFVHSVQAFLEDMKDSHIPAYSAQTAYFIIMSVFPFVLILLSLIRFTALTEDMLMEMISRFSARNILSDIKWHCRRII